MRLRRRRTTRLGEACMEPLFLEKPVRSVNFEQAFLNPSLQKISHEAAKHTEGHRPQTKSKGRARHAVAGRFWLNNQRKIFEPVDNMLFG